MQDCNAQRDGFQIWGLRSQRRVRGKGYPGSAIGKRGFMRTLEEGLAGRWGGQFKSNHPDSCRKRPSATAGAIVLYGAAKTTENTGVFCLE
jgi:hypothetical protein